MSDAPQGAWERLQRIFRDAIELSKDDRERFLAEACGKDTELRDHLEKLLAANDATGVTRDADSQGTGGFLGVESDLPVGSFVGGYRITGLIGEGGMASVYEARQEAPQRTVALKVMRSHLVTEGLRRRFTYETEVLGRLHHENIAQIFEAGTYSTPHGERPFFAMEYLEGAIPLTTYAQEHDLGTRERCALFARICDAVHHGHQKGVIHRDLKPNNILVTPTGVPKIIDFGVARAVDSDIAVTTIQTDVGVLIGTIQYMSPEQCAADPNDIDMRSDVYALGVVLYELLCDRMPYDIKKRALHEAVRIVQEEEPTKPSSFDKRMRGDVETITLKALEKDRERRYQSAEAMKEDLTRYLKDEPITARRPGAVDALGRFARKHRAAAAAIVAVFVVLVLAVIGVSIFALETNTQRQVAVLERDRANDQTEIAELETVRAQAVTRFVASMLDSVKPELAGSMDKELMKRVLSDAADDVGARFDSQPIVEAEIRSIIGRTYTALGIYGEAEPHLVEALAIRRRELGNEHMSTLISIGDMANVLGEQDKLKDAEPYYREALETRRRVLGKDHQHTLTAINNLGTLVKQLGKYSEAEELYREALEGRQRTLGDEHQETLTTIFNIGSVLKSQRKYKEAEGYYRDALGTSRRTLGNEHPITLTAINNLAAVLIMQGNYEEGEPYMREALEARRRVFGDEHRNTLTSIINLGSILYIQDKYEEAEPYLREGVETSRRVLGNEHSLTLSSVKNLADLLVVQKRLEEAERHYLEVLETRRRVQGEEHPHALDALNAMGYLLQEQEKYDEAEQYYREVLTINLRVHGDEHPESLLSMRRLSSMLRKAGKYDSSEMLCRQALTGMRRIQGEEHPDTLVAIFSMGKVLILQGKFEEAEAIAIECHALNETIHGPEHEETIDALELLVELYESWGRPEEAARYREMLEASETTQPEPSGISRR